MVKNSIKIPIIFKEIYTSKNIAENQKIDGEIAQDIIIDNTTIFKKGDRASLNIAEIKKAGFVGISGELHLIDGEAIDTKGNSHTIEYNHKFIGEEKTYPKICLACGLLIILAPLALFGFVKGGQAKVPNNQIIYTALKNDFIY